MVHTQPRIIETFNPFGALVEGLDFGQPTAVQTATVKRLLTQHHLLVSRGHVAPSDDVMESYFAGFGELSAKTPEVRAHFQRLAKLVPEYLENAQTEVGARFNLSNVEKDGKKQGGLGNRELTWHNDQADLPRLKTLSCLEALDFEEGAGNTFFCDMYAAAETLPVALRRQLEDVFALHDSGKYRSNDGASIAAAPASTHPIILAHPETGRRCLYVNVSFTSHVIGLPRAESDALLDQLRRHAYAPEFIYEHHWRTGDIVIWDNVGLQHMRPPLDSGKRRTLRVFQGVSEAWRLPSGLMSSTGGTP